MSGSKIPGPAGAPSGLGLLVPSAGLSAMMLAGLPGSSRGPATRQRRPANEHRKRMHPPSVRQSGLLVCLLQVLVGIHCTEPEGSDSGSGSSHGGARADTDGGTGEPRERADAGFPDESEKDASPGAPADDSAALEEQEMTDADADAMSAAPSEDGIANEGAGGNGGSTSADAGAGSLNPEGGLPNEWPEGKYIAVDEVHQRLEAGDADLLLVNVVDEEFYNLGHLPNSLKIPWDILPEALGEVDPDRHVVLYCRRGVRSEPAYETLVDNGYPMVWVMEGGIEAWSAEGFPTVPE